MISQARRMSRVAAVFLIFACTLMKTPVIRAQPPATANYPEFTVASLKSSPPAQGPTIVINGLGTFRKGRLTFSNASLSDLLKFAYNITSDEQLIGPDWIKSKDVRFEVVALAPIDTPRDQLGLMLQTLLAEPSNWFCITNSGTFGSWRW